MKREKTDARKEKYRKKKKKEKPKVKRHMSDTGEKLYTKEEKERGKAH